MMFMPLLHQLECHVSSIIVLHRVHCKVILRVLFYNSIMNSTFQPYEGYLAEMKLLVQYQVLLPLFYDFRWVLFSTAGSYHQVLLGNQDDGCILYSLWV